jgi:hypothetical protein
VTTAEGQGVDVPAVTTAQLFTESRAADAVVWDDNGTFRADGPDGEIDSGGTAATVIQSALDDIGNGIVALSLGLTTVASTIVIDTKQQLVGRGSATTRLQASGTHSGNSVLRVAGAEDSRLEGLTADANGNLGDAIVIDGSVNSVNKFEAHDVSCNNANRYGTRVDGIFFNFLFNRCTWENNGNAGFYNDLDTNEGSFIRCKAKSNGGSGPPNSGFYLRQNNDTDASEPRGIAFENCTASGNDTYGVNLQGVKAVSLETCYVENNGFAGILLKDDSNGNPAREVSVSNSWLYENDHAVLVLASRNCEAVSNHIDAGNDSVSRGIEIDAAAKDFEHHANEFVVSGSGSFGAEIDDDGTRTRRHGTIKPQSLAGVTGQKLGDRGLDDGTNVSTSGPMLCVWTGSAWQPSDGGTTFS